MSEMAAVGLRKLRERVLYELSQLPASEPVKFGAHGVLCTGGQLRRLIDVARRERGAMACVCGHRRDQHSMDGDCVVRRRGDDTEDCDCDEFRRKAEQ